MTFKRKTQTSQTDAATAKYNQAIAALSFTDAEAAKLRALAAAIYGEDYVRNIESMAIENAAGETYTPEGFHDARKPAPLLVDMVFAFDPDGQVGMRGPKSRALLPGWIVASSRNPPAVSSAAPVPLTAPQAQQSRLMPRPAGEPRQPSAKAIDVTMLPRGMSVEETAAYIGVHRGTLYRLAKAGKIRALKIAGKTIFMRDEVDRYLDSLPPAYSSAMIRPSATHP